MGIERNKKVRQNMYRKKNKGEGEAGVLSVLVAIVLLIVYIGEAWEIRTSIKEAFKYIWNLVCWCVGGLWACVCGFFSWIWDNVCGFFSWICSFFPWIWDNVCGFFSWICSFFPWIWDNVGGIFS